MLLLDTSLTNKAIRQDWFAQLLRLPASHFDSIAFTHIKLRWIIERGITRLTSLKLNKPANLQEHSLLHCCWPALHSVDLRGVSRSRSSCYPPPTTDLVHLLNIDHITRAAPGLRNFSAVGETVQALPHALDLLTLRCPYLESVSIESCRHALPDTALGQLVRLQHLQSLCLQGASSITDAGLAILFTTSPSSNMTTELLSRPPRLVSLRVLNLNQCSSISTAGCHLIAASCSKLDILALADCVLITDEGIVAVALRNPALTGVVLNRCYQLGDASLMALYTHCRLLQTLFVQGCVNMSREAVQALRDRNPAPCQVWV